MKEVFNLWKNTPGMCEGIPVIEYYNPEVTKSDAAVVIFPGGGYLHRVKHEGEGYANFLNENGISAFVVQYRVSPHRFPLELLDARRSVRFVRFYAEKFSIDKNMICVMADRWEDCSPNLIAGENTHDAFIWHTFEDGAVNVINSLDYAKN